MATRAFNEYLLEGAHEGRIDLVGNDRLLLHEQIAPGLFGPLRDLSGQLVRRRPLFRGIGKDPEMIKADLLDKRQEAVELSRCLSGETHDE